MSKSSPHVPPSPQVLAFPTLSLLIAHASLPPLSSAHLSLNLRVYSVQPRPTRRIHGRLGGTRSWRPRPSPTSTPLPPLRKPSSKALHATNADAERSSATLKVPCDRCIQSGLRCTRDIARKRRGPKKGSGSVIAKLRDETDQTLLGNVALPQYDLPPLMAGNGLSPLYRTPSGEGIFSSVSGAYVSGFAPRSHPVGLESTSVPPGNPIVQDPGMSSGVSQYASSVGDLDSPLPWRPADPHANSQYPSPEPSGYLTVNELAHKIFNDADPPPLAYHVGNTDNRIPTPDNFAQAQNPSLGHPSIDAILSAAAGSGRSATANSTSPPGPHIRSRCWLGPQRLQVRWSHSLQLWLPRLVSRRISCRNVSNSTSYTSTLSCPSFTRHRSPAACTSRNHSALEEKCLLVALCAMAIMKAAPASDLNFDAKKDICRRFLSHVLEIRKQSEWIESATLTSIITSYCVAVAHWELKQYRSHCLYLREAVGLALEQGLHLDSSLSRADAYAGDMPSADIRTALRHRTRSGYSAKQGDHDHQTGLPTYRALR